MHLRDKAEEEEAKDWSRERCGQRRWHNIAAAAASTLNDLVNSNVRKLDRFAVNGANLRTSVNT